MTAPQTMQSPPEPPRAVAPERLAFMERLSDRLNPIFLRELQQAFNARAFLGVIGAALACILLLGLLVALRADQSFASGREVFLAVMFVLTPVMTVVLPMQAFNSMQHELREGAVDQLLMSELSPRRIVRGKLMAAGLLTLVFLSVVAPMLAITYLLRGIDVATIAICLVFTLLFAIAAAAVGMAMGALTMIKPLQALARVGVSLVLAGLTIGVMASLYEVVRELSRMRASQLEELVGLGVGVAVGIVLMSLVAAAVLTHPYENRSTPFRVFPFAVGLLAYGLASWLSPAHIAEFSIMWALVASVGAAPFFMGALTEQPGLSPRVRTLVPRNRILALLSVPFLPGSDRGLWFVMAFLAAVGVPAIVLSYGTTPHGPFSPLGLRRILAMILCYVWIWACVLRIVRGDAPGQRARVRAFAFLLMLFAIACAGPAVVDLARSGQVLRWDWHHLMNPFFTLDRAGRRDASLMALATIAGVLLLVRVPKLMRGVREVLEASRARAG